MSALDVNPEFNWLPGEVPFGTEVEQAATGWIAPYGQVVHLLRTRDWLVHLTPDATLEARVAAMTHDIERMFPGGPTLDHAHMRWDDPAYLYPHQLRSAEFVGNWLTTEGHAGDVDVAEVRRLIGLHEVGGLGLADDVQAADSLSFLETLAGLAADWVRSGTCSRDTAIAKLSYSVDRIRLERALEPARALLPWAIDQIPTGSTEVSS
ncbi:hypothetical protein [Mycolicibacterium sp. 050158]|uniref:hypothetical protein n=1 Tax=Mycolicibacterium sp. 050158 TaxID=3090602 RepID=UPI00299F4BA0|nr:hypothetical protein [Mycolicibacterium sp. 050158]MDX1887990.1 hypothetical protein [Mycolicibacterium sp. 050158]